MPLIDRIRVPLQSAGGDPRAALLAVAPTLAALVLVIVLAAQLAGLAWRLIGAGEDSAMAPPAVGGPPAPTIDVGAIVNAHLFGIAPATGRVAAEAATSNLVLAGTLAGRKPEEGWAILGPSQQAARVYATGATLPGGARLVAVYADRVILERGGRREYLALPRLTGGAGPVPAAAIQRQSEPQALIDGVRELVAQNPGAVSELLRPQPVFAGGQLRGYRIYPGRNRQQFARLGLQPGDLVTAVNGTPLDDPNRGLEALQGIGTGGAATLSVDRNGQVQQITLDVAAAAQEVAPAGTPVQMPPLDVVE